MNLLIYDIILGFGTIWNFTKFCPTRGSRNYKENYANITFFHNKFLTEQETQKKSNYIQKVTCLILEPLIYEYIVKRNNLKHFLKTDSELEVHDGLVLVIAWHQVQLTINLTSGNHRGVIIFLVLWTRKIYLLKLPRVKFIVKCTRNQAITG